MIVALVPRVKDLMSSPEPSRSEEVRTDSENCFDQRNNCFEENLCECSKTTLRDIIAINVGGQIFQTKRSTLKRYPDTLLGSDEIEDFFIPETKEYFFDRNRSAFEPILYYYQSDGLICLPSNVNPDVFVEELRFYKIDETVIKRLVSPIEKSTSSVDLYTFKYPLQKKLWQLFDEPQSSAPARALGYFDQIVIFMAVICQCLESLPAIREAESPDQNFWGIMTVSAAKTIIMSVERVSIIWFTLDFIMRIVTCPDKHQFVKSLLNWFDLLAVIPFYLELMAHHLNPPFIMVLRLFRALRIVRIFKISRYFQGLFALGYALRQSAGELLILTMTLITFVALYSSLMFFSEGCAEPCDEHGCGERCSADDPNQFDSVVAGFWWSIVTMSTVGYGDYVPKTPLGKLVGGLCALTGILVISLPFPIIITNFNRFMKIRRPKVGRYATIDDGCHENFEGKYPEYSGVAYGFLPRHRTERRSKKINNDEVYMT
ncbi:hypothetical protein ACHWQZ_G004603 [Mnemiopsis leidyi]